MHNLNPEHLQDQTRDNPAENQINNLQPYASRDIK